MEMTDKNNNIDDKIVRGYGEQALRNEAQAILDQMCIRDRFAMRMTGMLQVEKLVYQVSFWYIDAETMKFCKLRIGIVAGC